MKKGEKMKYTYYQLGIMAAVVSFLGFVVENIWLAMTKGYINNRNMNAPFLLGYGLLILFMYAVFGTPAALRMFTKEKVRWKRYLVYFLCSFAVVCVGEIVLGIAVAETVYPSERIKVSRPENLTYRGTFTWEKMTEPVRRLPFRENIRWEWMRPWCWSRGFRMTSRRHHLRSDLPCRT